MKRRKNPYPGVRKNIVKGNLYWKFERGDYRCNIPGPYGSPAFLAAYEAALRGAKVPPSTAAPGTVSWLIQQYLGSLKYLNLSESRRRTIRLELDWLRGETGKYHFARLEVRHVEALMAKKIGPTAANTVKKNMTMLFNFASKKLSYKGTNPARFAEKMKTNPDGYHTWTDAEVDRFLDRHPAGSKARLILLLALNTGMARQDLCRVGWQHVSDKDGVMRIAYKRAKTSVAADLPVLPGLAEELTRLPRDRLLFITQDAREIGYKPETLGNWFRVRCVEAKVPGSMHGLRKAGATRLADAGATNWEIASYLAHTNTKQADLYTKKANRAKLADSGFAKLRSMSNPPAKLDETHDKNNKQQAPTVGGGSP